MKYYIILVLYLCATIKLYPQKYIIDEENNIKIDCYRINNDIPRTDIVINDLKHKEKYSIISAFFGTKQPSFLAVDLDNDGKKEFILYGLTGGKGIPVEAFLIDLKFSTKPVCSYFLMEDNLEEMVMVSGNMSNIKLLLSSFVSFGANIYKQIVYSCYDYANGKMIFNENTEDPEYKSIYNGKLSFYKTELDELRKIYWKIPDYEYKNVTYYYSVLIAYVLQNTIIDKNYNIDKCINYYVYRDKSKVKEISESVVGEYNRITSDDYRYNEYDYQ